MSVATAILNSLVVLYSDTSPDGERGLTVSCADFSVYKVLPAAVTCEGIAYGLTGWNSDRGHAYYKTGQRLAVAL